jgi:UDP-N-acetylmuramyl pentapeptide phosphotransferase/UDP-N-acetylglucosamine-1-phosphate transferase
MFTYFLYFVATFLLSILVTGIAAVLMRKYGVLDRAPKKSSRKIHKRSIPLGGGVALFVTFFLVVIALWLTQGEFRTSF